MLLLVQNIMIIIVGDVNVDFNCGGLFAKFLKDFMTELDLCVCDLSFFLFFCQVYL